MRAIPNCDNLCELGVFPKKKINRGIHRQIARYRTNVGTAVASFRTRRKNLVQTKTKRVLLAIERDISRNFVVRKQTRKRSRVHRRKLWERSCWQKFQNVSNDDLLSLLIFTITKVNLSITKSAWPTPVRKLVQPDALGIEMGTSRGRRRKSRKCERSTSQVSRSVRHYDEGRRKKASSNSSNRSVSTIKQSRIFDEKCSADLFANSSREMVPKGLS